MRVVAPTRLTWTGPHVRGCWVVDLVPEKELRLRVPKFRSPVSMVIMSMSATASPGPIRVAAPNPV